MKTKTLPLLVLFLFQNSFAAVPGSPEARVQEISSLLKPISNQQWAQIAGERSNQVYTITRGDTLYGISERIFGDGNYWPKIWALNNSRIMNPHLIYPGKEIAFYPGSGDALPGINIENVSPEAAQAYQRLLTPAKRKPTEWRELPRQRWEMVQLSLPRNIDPDGFDQSNRVQFYKSNGYSLNATTSTQKIHPIGTIIKAKEASNMLSLANTVFIEAAEEIEIGQEYTVTEQPIKIESPEKKRIAYSYVNFATVTIQAENNGIYVGKITESTLPFRRGAILITKIGKKHLPQMKEAEEEQGANMMVIPQLSTYTTAQHKQVFIDAGSEDGIEIGMVWRSFQEEDQASNKPIARQPTVSNANYLVIDVRETFCSAIIVSGNEPISTGQKVYLLTDISDLVKDRSQTNRSIEISIEPEDENDEDLDIDDLDALDTGDKLTDEEKKELQQLEDWKEDENLEGDEEIEGQEALTAPPPKENDEGDLEIEEDLEDDDEDILEAEKEESSNDNSGWDSSDEDLDLDDDDLEIDDAIDP